jgi:hypothetical protein
MVLMDAMTRFIFMLPVAMPFLVAATAIDCAYAATGMSTPVDVPDYLARIAFRMMGV